MEKEGFDFKVAPISSYNLWVHDEKFCPDDMILSLENFLNVKVGDLLSIRPTEGVKNDTSSFGNTLIVKVIEPNKEILSKQPLLQISWQSVSAEYIECTFKDQYLSRSDMWRIKSSILKTCVYKGQKILYAGCIRVQVSCGYVTSETKIIFRSETARSFIFIQMSSEMWHFEEDGYTYNEKLIFGFLTDLFEKWIQKGTNHIITLILFSRVIYDEEEYQVLKGQNEDIGVDSNGTYYKDFYKVLVEWETLNDWFSLMPIIKNEAIFFKKYILEFDNGVIARRIGEVAHATDGNFLEAINIALNEFDKHYVDRDLIRTGQQIIVVTPGNGHFKVDKDILRCTFERLDDCGLFLDLVCLSKKPPHVSPLLEFKTCFLNQSSPINKTEKPHLLDSYKGYKQEDRSYDIKMEHKNVLFTDITQNDPSVSEITYYCTPYWINISFYDSDIISYKREGQFLPCLKMRSLQRVGIFTNTKNFDHIPYLIDSNLLLAQQKLSFELGESDEESYNRPMPLIAEHAFDFDAYDDQVFELSGQKALNIKVQNKSFSNIGSGDAFRKRDRKSSPLSKNHTQQNSDTSFKDHSLDIQTHEILNPVSLSQSLPKNMNRRRKSSFSNLILNDKGIILSKKISENPDSSNLEKIDKNEKLLENKPSSSSKPINIKLNKDYFVQKSSPKQSAFTSRRTSPSKELQKFTLKTSFKFSNNSFVDDQFYINPFMSVKITRPIMSGRWQHVLSHPMLSSGTQWESLCIPPCLPITTSYFPSWEELSHCYEEYNYTVSPNYDEMDERFSISKNTKDLLEELICQRLAQGFQMVIFEAYNSGHSKSSKLGSGQIMSSDEAPSVFDKIGNRDFSNIPIPCYLTSGNHIHRLMYDSTGQNVEVKRFARKITYSTIPIKYVANIWTKTTENYQSNKICFNYPKPNAYNWNYLDHLISGYQDEMNEGLKFWRARFVLLPGDITAIPSGFLSEDVDNLSEEEVRLSGFCKFLEQFQKVCLRSESESSSNDHLFSTHINGLDIKFTTFTPSGYFISEFNGQSTNSSFKRGFTFNEKLSKESKLSTIINLLKHPVNGVKLSDRRWHVKMYVNVFVGNEFVDWCLKYFNDIKTREEAVQFGNQLMKKGIIEHCLHKHPFLDGHYFYGLKSGPSSVKKNKNSWFKYNRNVSSNSSEASSSLTQLLSNFSLNQDISSNIKVSSNEINNSKVILSKRMMINLDISKKSCKRETAFLHYDTLFNPKHCYHFQIYWLGCTARLIDDLLQNWSRVAEKCGLKLIEAPFYQTFSSSQDSPFRVPFTIEFSCSPPDIIQLCQENNLHSIIYNGIPKDYFEAELAKSFDFILDVESDDLFPQSFNKGYSYTRPQFKNTQYIHRSGMIILQLLPNRKGYLLENNRAFLNSNSQNTYRHNTTNINDENLGLTEKIRINLVEFCNNYETLREFWLECSSKLTTRQGLESILENVPSHILSALDDQFPVSDVPFSPDSLSEQERKAEAPEDDNV